MKKVAQKFMRRLKSVLSSENEQRHSLVGRAELWKMKRQFQIEYLKSVGLKPYHYLLDFGCGTLRGGIPIIAYLDEGHYYGLESRLNVLEEGWKELLKHKLQHKKPVLQLVEDIATVTCGPRFDFVWAFSVLFHMEDDTLNEALDCIQRHLKPSGNFYANINLGSKDNECWQGFPVVWRSYKFYNETAAKHGFVLTDMGTLESLGHITGIHSQDLQRMLRFSKV